MHDPYDSERPLQLRCACGQPHAPQEHAAAGASPEQRVASFMEAALVKAIFPRDAERRLFLRAVGRRSAMAAIASIVPLGTLQALAQEARPPEKRDLKVGFIAITCATPLQREHDASHFLSPMPIAMSLGLGSTATPTSVATIQNVNGQAITLARKHLSRREPRSWKGFKLGVPFEHSMHNFLLRYYLAEHGVNPDTDVQIVVVPPPQMVAQLKEGAIDGFLGPDPFNQRAVYDGVGFIHVLSKDIWDGHPCCAFGVSDAFIAQHPNSFAALFRAVIGSSFIASVSTDRAQIAKLISTPSLLNQPEEVVAQVLTGNFPDGLGNTRSVPDRALFDPVPWQSMAIWMLTQMKRWGYIKGDVNYAQIAQKVFMLTDAKRQMAAAGWRAPEGTMRKIRVMGRTFDPEAPESYVRSFPIHKVAA
jgi:nitrate/nitrite transport system substrate-binding protein